jgi:hypothetical protein
VRLGGTAARGYGGRFVGGIIEQDSAALLRAASAVHRNVEGLGSYEIAWERWSIMATAVFSLPPYPRTALPPAHYA